MIDVFADLRTAWRSLLRNSDYVPAVILSLTIGIGVNLAAFSVARGVLLRPLPGRDPARLVMVWAGDNLDRRPIATSAEFLAWRDGNSTLSDLACVTLWRSTPETRMDLVTAEGALRLRGALATPNFFDVIGVGAAIGRTFRKTANGPVPEDEVVISDALWRKQFGGDAATIGRTVRLEVGRGDRRERVFTVVGVLPSTFRFTYPEETEVWAVLPWTRVERAPKAAVAYHVIGRLRDGSSVQGAEADLRRTTSGMRNLIDSRTRLPYTARPASVESLSDWVTAQVRPAILLLNAIALACLLVACVNVGALLLARTMGRTQDMAVRLSLGARRSRLARELLLESFLLGGLGAICALAVSYLTQSSLRAMLPLAVPRTDEVRLDWLVVVAAFALASCASMGASVAPLWHAGHFQPQRILQDGSPAVTGGRIASAWQNLLAAAQTAIVLALLVAAALLLKSFWELQHVDPGFDGTGVLTAEMRLVGPRFRAPGRIAAFHDELLRRLRAMPGVRQVASSSAVPMRGADWTRAFESPGGKVVTANERQVDPDYFPVLRIPLKAGRSFSSTDTDAGVPVAIVSESFAKRYFPDGNAIGKELEIDRRVQIVGVVGDVRYKALQADPMPAVYIPRNQNPSELICLLIRTAAGFKDPGRAIRATVRAIDPQQPVEAITTIDAVVASTIADRRFYALVAGMFGAVALLLAAVGLYGSLSRVIMQRTREFGVRMALGAERGQIMRTVWYRATRPLALGASSGVVLSWWGSSALQRFLFGVESDDPSIYIGALAVLMVVCGAACYLPARRASLLNPVDALRNGR